MTPAAQARRFERLAKRAGMRPHPMAADRWNRQLASEGLGTGAHVPKKRRRR